MMAGNPNWWSINSMHPQSHQFLYDNSSSTSDHNHHHHHQNQDFPVKSWSQLLIGGEEERFGGNLFQQQKKLENWEDQVLNLNPSFRVPVADVKQEVAQSSTCQLYHEDDHQFHQNKSSNSWLHTHNNQVLPVSPPTSCITSILNFSGSGGKAAAVAAATQVKSHHHNQDHSSECNSSSSGGITKKARVQQSSAQPALKVRKEKLGDRITALHQLVSPFGKTDTASVLSEAIGYIRFLQGQIEALSSPYMRNGSTVHQQHSVQERNCLFSEDSGQFLNYDHMGMEGKAPSKQDSQSRGVKDLRSRGLCLVPISCTQNVGNDTGADYWAPAALGGGGF